MKKYREILKMAILNEVEAYEFYKNAAAKMKDTQIKKIFEELAEEEAGHRALLENYISDEKIKMKFKREKDYRIAETIETPQILSADMAFKDAVALAMKKEQDAMEMYRQFADASEDAEQRKTFLELVKMEQGHKVRLEDIYTQIAFIEIW